MQLTQIWTCPAPLFIKFLNQAHFRNKKLVELIFIDGFLSTTATIWRRFFFVSNEPKKKNETLYTINHKTDSPCDIFSFFFSSTSTHGNVSDAAFNY